MSQVLPFGARAHPAVTGTLALLYFPETNMADVVYQDVLTSALYVEEDVQVHTYGLAVNHLAMSALGTDDFSGADRRPGQGQARAHLTASAFVGGHVPSRGVAWHHRPVRYNRVIAAVALLGALGSSCTSEKPKDAFNPTPKPTRPGQVVIVAGQDGNSSPPQDGDYALRVGMLSNGGLAVDKQGRLYIALAGGGIHRIARVETDGRVSILSVDNQAEQIAVSGDDLWVLSTNSGIRISRVSISTLKRTGVAGISSADRVRLELLGESGVPLSPNVREDLERSWRDSLLTVRSDGVPIVASSGGDLFEVSGPRTLKSWQPVGYQAALRDLGGAKRFRLTGLMADPKQGIVILGRTGLVRIGQDGHAKGFRFPGSAEKMPSWTAVVPLGDGSLLLLGGTSPVQLKPRPALMRPNGDVESLALGRQDDCERFDGSMSAIASADPGGIVRLPNGDYALMDKYCDSVYSFRIPGSLVGRPYHG